MPIKPENRHRYPPDWPDIRAAVLERAGHRCERCKAPDRQRIARGGGDDEGTYMLDTAEVFDAETGERLGQIHMASYQVKRMTLVVLTVAHLDHQPENCQMANLRAWCQRCHLAHDREHHKRSAWLTRRARSGTPDLFGMMEGQDSKGTEPALSAPEEGIRDKT